jgi:hypothetical protein
LDWQHVTSKREIYCVLVIALDAHSSRNLRTYAFAYICTHLCTYVHMCMYQCYGVFFKVEFLNRKTHYVGPWLYCNILHRWRCNSWSLDWLLVPLSFYVMVDPCVLAFLSQFWRILKGGWMRNSAEICFPRGRGRRGAKNRLLIFNCKVDPRRYFQSENWLGEFWPIGWLFILGIFFIIKKVAHFFRILFSTVKVMYWVWQKMAWATPLSILGKLLKN